MSVHSKMLSRFEALKMGGGEYKAEAKMRESNQLNVLACQEQTVRRQGRVLGCSHHSAHHLSTGLIKVRRKQCVWA